MQYWLSVCKENFFHVHSIFVIVHSSSIPCFRVFTINSGVDTGLEPEMT